jgi:hypothetical protein
VRLKHVDEKGHARSRPHRALGDTTAATLTREEQRTLDQLKYWREKNYAYFLQQATQSSQIYVLGNGAVAFDEHSVMGNLILLPWNNSGH